MARVCIVIPVYKEFEKLPPAERASIRQCMKVLNKYPIFLVGPISLDQQPYLQMSEEFKSDVKSVRFKDKYFKSIEGYNKLLLSPFFYRAFSAYEYMLIYQPDAWVFSDELEYWCRKGFDYIGSPWFDDWGLTNGPAKIISVGNGGFSLRRIESYVRVLKSFSYISPLPVIWKRLFELHPKWWMWPANLFRFILNSTVRNNTFHLFNTHEGNEDGLWVFFASKNFKWFRLADIESARQFGFETHPAVLLAMNQGKLPFGCHAWEKYDPEFWKPYIQIDR